LTDLVFVGHRCCDHSPSSGYDQVCSIFPEAGWLDGRALAAGVLRWEREPRGAASSRSVFHVFYGDCSGSALPALVRERFPDAIVVSTFHQPVSRLIGDRAAMASLVHTDAVITVSDAQARDLRALEPGIPVRAAPHGVWTAAFRPARPYGEPRRDVLLVGTYLRDWDAAVRVVDSLAGQGVRSVVVGANAHGARFAGRELVDVSPRLGERELAQLYDRSAALFLPVADATASNAVLEAMAAGCPVVCTACPSLVDEYLGDRADCFEQGADAVAVSRLLRYVADPRRRASRSSTLMRRAERFDWRNLRERYRETYDAIVRELRRTPPSAARSTRASASSPR
jgi:glycosyltransferase involved in cell wall biosynthesis